MSSPPPAAAYSPCPSPSPSLASATTTATAPGSNTPSSNTPGWHFPGPSTKYHRTERQRPAHSRFKSSYVARAPVLSTERRAHARAQSYQHARGLPSPPGSESGRSPLARFPSYMTGANAPATPSRIPVHSRRSSLLLQDSPFSDYFTDDARSDGSAPVAETQHLLVRLGKLQSALMRGRNAPELLEAVGHRVADLEEEVGGAWVRTPLAEEDEEMGESGYFTEEEKDVLDSARRTSGRASLGLDGAADEADDVPDPKRRLDWGQDQQDKLLGDAQTALKSLTTAQRELKKRYRELSGLYEDSCAQMEDRETEIEKLRSENESLKSDLGFDHSELLFLELQMKGLEVEGKYGEGVKTERLQKVVDSWRDDWRDVEARFKRRAQTYGVNEEQDAEAAKLSAAQSDDENGLQDWKVDVQKSSHRVASLTLRRISKEAPEDATTDGAEDSSVTTEAARPESLATPKAAYTSAATQTAPSTLPFPPEAFASPVLEKSEHDFAFPTDQANDEDQPEEEEVETDCAITTSPPSYTRDDVDTEVDDEDGDEDVARLEQRIKELKRKAREERKRGAWRELWEGLADWAGVGGEEAEEA